MKKSHRTFCLIQNTAFLILITASSAFVASSHAVEWEDQSIFRINKEEPHATKMPFPTTEMALSKQRLESPYATLLNGEWKYHWSPRPEKRPVDFYQEDFDDGDWGTIKVPANVELEGHGVPIYSNDQYLFKRDAPRVMGEPEKHWTSYEDRNPVSSYRKIFSLPDSWQGRQTFVVFNGVESAFYLWCNGQKVGYSQDSRTPAEFNLTPYLKSGENTLAVEVYRFSDGSYLEDQDFWRLSGIFRDVYLWSTADLDLRDFEIRASLDSRYEQGTLSVKTWTKNYAKKKATTYSVDIRLLDEESKELASMTIQNQTVTNGTDSIAETQVDGLDVEPWSAEKPKLYDLLLTLKDAEGNAIAHYSRKIGFRTTEIKAGQLLVNGKPVLIKGVNRHDHHHITGHYVSEEAMREDLDQMKRLNVNAIRTSHYPNDPRFLELCDEYGFYVVSEANIETHGYGRSGNPLPKDMSWYPAHLDRIRNNVEMHKNHACAIIWSLGNEAGDGPVFTKALEWVHERDPSRPVQYENALVSDYRPSTPVEIFAPMYYHISKVPAYVEQELQKAEADRRPLIQCEYSHAMGNSCGGLAEYWDLVRALPLYQGGFIWDWRDQGLLRYKETTNGDKVPYFAYGGDFNDHPNSNNFCMNGVVGADTTPNPHAYEVRHQYRNILTELLSADSPSEIKLQVTNENFFTDLEGKHYRWKLLEDGNPVASGKGTLPLISPQSTHELTINTETTLSNGSEYIISIEYLQGEDRPWADADFVVARDQALLPWGSRKPEKHQSGLPVEFKKSDNETLVSGNRFQIRFDNNAGQLISYQWDGNEKLVKPLRLNFWRPPIDNDRGNGMPDRHSVWREAGEKAHVSSMSVESLGNSCELTYDIAIPAEDTTAHLTYTVYGDGVFDVKLHLKPSGSNLPSLPRIGMQLQVDRKYDNWTWYGRGPWENYNDRNSGAYLGIHSGKISELFYGYSETQECMNRTGVRWSTFAMDNGGGFKVESADEQTLEIGTYPYAQSDLEGEKRTVDLVEQDYLTVHIAHAQMGVGGEDSWGARTLEKYQLPANRDYSYSFRIVPFSSQ